jgi:hypothetical protein
MTAEGVPTKVTDQLVPRGRSVSPKVRANTFAKLTASEVEVPLTARLPFEGLDPKPPADPIEKAYTPSGSENVSKGVVVLWDVPLRATDHSFPVGNPVSANETR